MKAIIGHIIFNVKAFNESELFYDKLLTMLFISATQMEFR